jgi:hypothetical protein
MYAEDAMKDRYDRMYSQYSSTGPYSELGDDEEEVESCPECHQFLDECICDLEDDDVLEP